MGPPSRIDNTYQRSHCIDRHRSETQRRHVSAPVRGASPTLRSRDNTIFPFRTISRLKILPNDLDEHDSTSSFSCRVPSHMRVASNASHSSAHGLLNNSFTTMRGSVVPFQLSKLERLAFALRLMPSFLTSTDPREQITRSYRVTTFRSPDCSSEEPYHHVHHGHPGVFHSNF